MPHDTQPDQTREFLLPAAPVPGEPPTPPTITGYELQEEIGRGGMGVVWKARQVSLNRIVALKMLLAGDAAGPVQVARFQAEAAAVARLQHPSIVQIFEVGRQDGRVYFSLEYVGGGTLADRLAGTPLPVREAAAIVEELANAVQYAHERNVLHRDLKPGNVLLTPEGRLKLTDFGLAKLFNTDDAGIPSDGHTRTGAILGTPSYMAPEQAWGDGGQIGPRVDVYALGAILYECLTGRAPFRGATLMDTLEQVRHEEPVPPRRLNPAVPRDLETICLKCLSKELTGRYASARELAQDLRRFLDGDAVLARPVGYLGRAWRAARQRPSTALAVVFIGLTLVFGVGGGLAFWLYQSSERSRQQEAGLRAEAENARLLAEQAQTQAVELAGRLERVYYLQQVQSAVRAWEGADIPRARSLLDECSVRQRGWEWHYARRLLHPLVEVEGITPPLDLAAFLPDGKGILTGGRIDGLRVWDPATGNERLVLEGTQRKGGAGGVVGFVGGAPLGVVLISARDEAITSQRAGSLEAWSLRTGKRLREVPLTDNMPVCRAAAAPDASWLAFSYFGSTFIADRPPIFVVDPLTGKSRAQLVQHTQTAGALAASADGKRLATGTGNGEVILWDMARFQAEDQIREPFQGIAGLAFSPDGETLYGALEEGGLTGWTVPKLVPRFRTVTGSGKLTCLALNSAGTRIACGTVTGEILLFEASSGKRLATYRGHLRPRPEIIQVSFSPDGNRLASIGHDRSLRIWEVTQPQTTEVVEFPLQGGAMLLAEGATLISVYPDGMIRTWNTANGSEGARHRIPPGDQRVVATASRSPRACVPAGDGSLRVWDWQADRPLATLAVGADRVESLALDATGARVFASGSLPAGPFFRCWDVADGREPFALPGVSQPLVALDVSPEGRLLAAQSEDGTIRVWSLPEGQEVFRLRGQAHERGPLRFSPDGSLLAGTTSDGLRVWATGDWRERFRARLATPLECLAFTADGKRLATVSDRVTVWDLIANREALTLPDVQRLSALTWSPDGRVLIGAETDGRLYHWRGE